METLLSLIVGRRETVVLKEILQNFSKLDILGELGCTFYEQMGLSRETFWLSRGGFNFYG